MRLIPARNAKAPRKTPNISRLYMKMKSRITLLFVLLVMLPSLITASVIYLHTRSLMEEKTYESALSRISKENGYIGSCLEELQSAVDLYVRSIGPDHMDRIAAQPNDSPTSALLAEMAGKHLSPAHQKALSGVYIIDATGIRAAYGPDAKSAVISDPSAQKWFRDALENRDLVYMLGTVQRFYANGVSKIVLSAAKSALSGTRNGRDHVMLFDFNQSLISDFLKVESAGPADAPSGIGAERIIIDRDGCILYSRDEGKLSAKASDQLLSAISDKDSDFLKIYYNGSRHFMTYVRYPEHGWTFIDLVPVSAATGRLWIRSPLLTAVLAAFGAILLIFLILLLRQLRPINDLTSVISDYESHFSGNSAHLPLLQIKNDVSAVDSASDIDLLINKISRIKLSQKEAELNSLQNQINPHFLYNTLESIRGAALYHGIHEIASMAKSLSLLFRYSISERVLVSVKEELQHLENYISIQNFRFENKFELQYSIPPELMDYKILKLTLQPLIENSIKHGLEMKLGKGTIKIEILSLDSNIKIIISDDGLGMPSKKLEELNRSIANDRSRYTGGSEHSGTGIGVMNVNSRIKLYFGEQYGLRFRESTVGTTVEITLPAVMDS
jgi:two-component system sensor histidine kinase YesM